MSAIPIYHYLTLSSILFVIGACGLFLLRRTIITIMISIEIMLLAVNINFVTFSNLHNDISGQIFALFILAVAASEAAIGLAILISYYRLKGDIKVENVNIEKYN